MTPFFFLKTHQNDVVLGCYSSKKKQNRPIAGIGSVLPVQRFSGGSSGSPPVFGKTIFDTIPGSDDWPVPSLTGQADRSGPIFRTIGISI